jgi:glycosyltransferase involved in cell wall biosynthesis
MRILFLNPGGSLGGAERCLLDLVASIRAHPRSANMELGLIVGGDGPLSDHARALGMRAIPLPLGDRLAAVGDSALNAHGMGAVGAFARRLATAGLATPDYARRLRAAIRDFKPYVVHSNGIKMHLLAAAVRGDEPLVWHVRDFIGNRPFVSRAMRALARRASAAIAISNAVAADAHRTMPNLPVSVMHDAIDTDEFSPSGAVADLDVLAGCAPAPAGVLRVGLVATYARWKGHEVFLRAAQRLRAAAPASNALFYIVGGAIYDTKASQYDAGELLALARALGIADRVRFVPFQPRVDEVFRALDVVVHSSSQPEPFGRTIAEAMATGKPVVASKASGAAELFVDGVEAIATPARDAEALARALETLLGDPARRDSLGKAARAAAVDRFARGRLAEQLFQVYRSAGCGG